MPPVLNSIRRLKILQSSASVDAQVVIPKLKLHPNVYQIVRGVRKMIILDMRNPVKMTCFHSTASY